VSKAPNHACSVALRYTYYTREFTVPVFVQQLGKTGVMVEGRANENNELRNPATPKNG